MRLDIFRAIADPTNGFTEGLKMSMNNLKNLFVTLSQVVERKFMITLSKNRAIPIAIGTKRSYHKS